MNITDQADPAPLPLLTVRELRLVISPHLLASTYLRADQNDGERGWRGDCDCGKWAARYRSMSEVTAAHELHLCAVQFDARLAKHKAALYGAMVL